MPSNAIDNLSIGIQFESNILIQPFLKGNYDILKEQMHFTQRIIRKNFYQTRRWSDLKSYFYSYSYLLSICMLYQNNKIFNQYIQKLLDTLSIFDVSQSNTGKYSIFRYLIIRPELEQTILLNIINAKSFQDAKLGTIFSVKQTCPYLPKNDLKRMPSVFTYMSIIIRVFIVIIEPIIYFSLHN
ncbi:hypothetical protein FGO68_gene11992 [Halteria grandinella]|uniref:Transmembrane protein n=1 Tax=Halteria grandinella TaxID=5974 RepID=A0A8J8NSS0_HALGN|nr:hypothetical protein FGO68_gene11992 [Halteria grandinella]